MARPVSSLPHEDELLPREREWPVSSGQAVIVEERRFFAMILGAGKAAERGKMYPHSHSIVPGGFEVQS